MNVSHEYFGMILFSAIRLESKRKAESEKRYKIIKYKKKM